MAGVWTPITGSGLSAFSLGIVKGPCGEGRLTWGEDFGAL